MPDGRRVRNHPIAVIDIGSNSGRVVVYERDQVQHLRLLTGSRAPLRLVEDVDELARLSEGTMAGTMEALRDFKAIARGAGAKRIVAVATAAMRDAGNGDVFVKRVRRELGIRIDVIGGVEEARYGFAGAVRGLDVSNGMLFDLGGGSIQLIRFAKRRMATASSLPLGALRLSEHFLVSDPPGRKQIRRLRDHVRRHLAAEKLRRLGRGERLVGTGGTLRNLAKIDRHRRQYPVGRVHGYVLSVDRLSDIVDALASTREKRRDDIAGLSAERADSIVGGAIVIQTLAEMLHARELLVSGQGVREGVALEELDIGVGSPADVKEASLSSLVSRFAGWSAETAARRRAIAAHLHRSLEPDAEPRLSSALDHAARVLDIGRSIDSLNRHEHVANILLTTELNGFSHEEVTLMSAIVRRAGDRHADVESLEPLVHKADYARLDRAATLLALADAIEARCPRGRSISLTCDAGSRVVLSVPIMPSWSVKDLGQRFERSFGRPLIVRHGHERIS